MPLGRDQSVPTAVVNARDPQRHRSQQSANQPLKNTQASPMRSQALHSLYDQAAMDLPVLGTPTGTADRLRREMGVDAAADRLINRAVALSSATGFVCGLPGYATMPVVIPSNIAGVLLVQFHLCATLAALGGRDPGDPAVREEALRCVLAGAAAEQAAAEQEDAGDRDDEVGSPSEADPNENADRNGTEGDSPEGNEVSGLLSRFTSKLGERGVRFTGEHLAQWMGKTLRRSGHGSRSLPLLGGAIGAVADGMTTQSVGERARRSFLGSEMTSRS